MHLLSAYVNLEISSSHSKPKMVSLKLKKIYLFGEFTKLVVLHLNAAKNEHNKECQIKMYNFNGQLPSNITMYIIR